MSSIVNLKINIEIFKKNYVWGAVIIRFTHLKREFNITLPRTYQRLHYVHLIEWITLIMNLTYSEKSSSLKIY